MINIVPTVDNIDFIYTVKKALNLYVFTNPMVISDFIQILDEELRESIGTDAIKSFEFKDGEYQFTIVIDKNYVTDDTHDELQDIMASAVMEFCLNYEEEIRDAILKLGDKQAATEFEDCITCNNRKTLSAIVHKTEFPTDGGYCIIARFY